MSSYSHRPMYSHKPHCTVPKIVELINHAKKKDLQFPQLRLAMEGANVKIYPAAADSKNRGYLYVKRQNGEYLGKIAPNGDFFGDPSFVDMLRMFNSDPVGCATLYGKQTGHCCFCGLPLTDGRSVAVGYGPICAGNYGMPWGEDKVEPTVDLMDLKEMLPTFNANVAAEMRQQLPLDKLPTQLDITAPQIVEIEIRDDGTVIWVNIDGICALRACRIKELHVTDNRSIKEA